MINSITIAGRLVKEPEITFSKGKNGDFAIARFCVAVNNYKGEDAVDFFECSAFGGIAEAISRYIGKGDGIIVHGSMHSRKYTGKDDVTRTYWTIDVNDFDFGPKKLDEKKVKQSARR